MGLPELVIISCKGLLVGSRNWWTLGNELELSEIYVFLSFYILASSHFLLLCTKWEMPPATAPAFEPAPIGGASSGDCGSLQVYVVGPSGRKWSLGVAVRDSAPWGFAHICSCFFFFLFNLSPFVMTHTWGKTEGKRERETEGRGRARGEKKTGNPV